MIRRYRFDVFGFLVIDTDLHNCLINLWLINYESSIFCEMFFINAEDTGPETLCHKKKSKLMLESPLAECLIQLHTTEIDQNYRILIHPTRHSL
jgi:hypothetical protein